MILNFQSEQYLFYIDCNNIEQVITRLRKCDNLINIKNLEIDFIETSEKSIKDYCKNNRIKVSYGFTECIYLNYDLFIDDEKLKKICENNDFKYDETIKYLNFDNLCKKEKELYDLIVNEMYDEFISDAACNINDLIEEYEEIF